MYKSRADARGADQGERENASCGDEERYIIVKALHEALLGRSTAEEIYATLEGCDFDPNKAYAELVAQGKARFDFSS